MSIVDATMTREVLRDIGRRPVDAAELDVHVQHGVVYLRGRLSKIRGYYDDVDLSEELNIIIKILHQKPGIRDVVCEVDIGGLTLGQKVKQQHRPDQSYC